MIKQNQKNKCNKRLSDLKCKKCKKQVHFFFGEVSCKKCNWTFDSFSRPLGSLNVYTFCCKKEIGKL